MVDETLPPSAKTKARSTNRPGVVLAALLGAAVVVALYLVSRHNYLLFHSLVESFSIVIAFAIFAIAWNSRRIVENSYLLFVGFAFLAVAPVDLVHMLAYKGMGVFPGYDANLATQLWIAGRYLISLSLLLAPAFLGRRLNLWLAVAGFAWLTVLSLPPSSGECSPPPLSPAQVSRLSK